MVGISTRFALHRPAIIVKFRQADAYQLLVSSQQREMNKSENWDRKRDQHARTCESFASIGTFAPAVVLGAG